MANWRRRCSYLLALPAETCWRVPLAATLIALTASACGHAEEHAEEKAAKPAAPTDPANCIPAGEGALRARLQGEIDVDIDWGTETAHCRGGVRPQGDGVRLLYKGGTDATGPLLIVFGLAPLRPGESARNVPVNLTLVREGTGQFYATRGQDKCAFDEVRQTPIEAAPNQYRLEGRGYCTQPARALAGDGAVLVSRFDVVAIVDASISGAGP
jgi:hypothetical protein